MDDVGKRAKSIVPGTMPKWISGTATHFAYFVEKQPSINNRTRGVIHVAEWNSANQSLVGNPLPVTDSAAGEHFAWSQDGQWLVFESYRDNNWEICKVRRNGKDFANLTKNPAADETDPDWAHGGTKKIAFVLDKGGNRDVCVFDENGQGFVNLTINVPGLDAKPDNGDDWGPVWASDGDLIAFVGTHQAWGNYIPQIYVTSIATLGSLIVVTKPSEGVFEMPMWEGSQSLFYTTYGGSQILRYDLTTRKNEVVAALAIAGQQYAIDPKFLFVGTQSGDIRAVEWNRPGTIYTVGPGGNPASW